MKNKKQQIKVYKKYCRYRLLLFGCILCLSIYAQKSDLVVIPYNIYGLNESAIRNVGFPGAIRIQDAKVFLAKNGFSKGEIVCDTKCTLKNEIVLPARFSDSMRLPKEKSNIFKRAQVKALPLVSYNRSKGYMLGAMLVAFTSVEKRDTISPPSRTTIGTGFTENKSWFGVVAQQLYLNHDKWRVMWALGTGKSSFQYFEAIGDDAEGAYVDYNTRIDFFTSNVIYECYKRLYAGMRYNQSNSLTTFDDPSVRPDEETTLKSLGLVLNLDTRDYLYYPAKGVYVSSQLNRYAEWLGSDDEYTALTLFANHYKRLSTTSILASRVYVYTGLGEVPFVGQRAVGGKDLRGYTQGTYRSDKKTAIQSEWRYNFYKKWGLIAFAGLAYAFETETSAASGLLASGGAGLRYAIIPKMKMNAGFDFAVGKDDFGIYFRVGVFPNKHVI